MAITSDSAAPRKPGRPRKVAAPEVEVAADLSTERELQDEAQKVFEETVGLAPEYQTFRYLGMFPAVVVTSNGAYDARPNATVTLKDAAWLADHPDFVLVQP